jgi:hypothetical protein
MHYDSLPGFKDALQQAGFEGPASRIEILFEYYKHARRQSGLILGRLDDIKPLAEKYGTAFEGGKGQLLITPQGYNDETTRKQSAKWTVWLNDSFILGGIHGHALFYLKGNPDALDYADEKSRFVFNVTQRELIGLLTFGYSWGKGDDPRGLEYKCTNALLADGATFKSYVDKVQELSGAVKGN